MKHIIKSFEKIAPIADRARRVLIEGSGRLISGYAALPRLAKTGVHIAACAAVLWGAFGSDGGKKTGKAIPLSSAIPESPGEVAADEKSAGAEAARKALLEAQARQEAEIAEANRIHAEQQRRLVAEQIQARREQEAYLEQARYLQQLEAQQRNAAQRFQYEAQQSAGEQANREMQRYRSQMNGRPGF